MKIESKIQRPRGTFVTLDGEEYHFKPSAEHGGAHVAEVKDADHIDRLLAIPEGYRAVVEGRKHDPKPEPVQPPAEPVAPPVVDPVPVATTQDAADGTDAQVADANPGEPAQQPKPARRGRPKKVE